MWYIFIAVSRSNVVKIPYERKIIVRDLSADKKKSFIAKVIFFISLLIAVLISYIESSRIEDIIYFVGVLILFIKYLIAKLYH